MNHSSQKRKLLQTLAGVGAVVAAASAGAGGNKQLSQPRNELDAQSEIGALLVRWGYARDSDDWKTLSECFHDDASIHISWISASAREFVEKSKAMAAARKPGAHLKHIISPPWIVVQGNKAFTRTHATLFIREEVEGVGLDITSWIRFFDLMERRSNGWRIVKRYAVYEKDRLDPVDPRGFPPGFFDGMDLSKYPRAAKFLCYWLERIGRPSSSKNIIQVNTDEERALLADGLKWLAT